MKTPRYKLKMDCREIENALNWAVIGLLSWIMILVYLSARLFEGYAGKAIIGESIRWFTAGLIAFVIIPLTLTIFTYFTWIRPLQHRVKPHKAWQLILIILGTILYLVPGLILIIARKKLAHVPELAISKINAEVES